MSLLSERFPPMVTSLVEVHSDPCFQVYFSVGQSENHLIHTRAAAPFMRPSVLFQTLFCSPHLPIQSRVLLTCDSTGLAVPEAPGKEAIEARTGSLWACYCWQPMGRLCFLIRFQPKPFKPHKSGTEPDWTGC